MAEDTLLFKIQYYAFKVVKILFTSIANLIGLFEPDQKGQIPRAKNRILFKPAVQLVAEMRSGSLKSEDVIQAYIDRIREVNGIINAVVDERFQEALEQARQVDLLIKSYLDGNESLKEEIDRKPLLGLPFTAKDSIAVKGMVQTAGYWYRRGYKSPVDAPAVSLMRSRGAIPIALTNVPEILLWWDSTNLIYGQTRNPYDLSRVAGGSSGGEALSFPLVDQSLESAPIWAARSEYLQLFVERSAINLHRQLSAWSACGLLSMRPLLRMVHLVPCLDMPVISFLD